MLQTTQLSGFGSGVQGGGASAFGISFVDSFVNASELTTYTFTNKNIGAVAADRHIVVTLARQSSNAVNSVTVNGQTCKVVALTENTDNFSTIWVTEAWVPTGTTAVTVTVVFAGTAEQCGVGLFRMVGASETVSASATDTDITDNGAMTCTATVPAGGGYVCSARGGNNPSHAWTDDDTTTPTEGFDEEIDGGQHHSGAYNNTATSQTNLSVTVTPSPTTTEQGMCMATFAAA